MNHLFELHRQKESNATLGQLSSKKHSLNGAGDPKLTLTGGWKMMPGS